MTQRHRVEIPDELPVEETWGVLEPARVQSLAALLDNGMPVPGAGDPLPPLWHWVAWPSWPMASVTGADGHPLTGGLIPDLGKPRRMFAGGRVDFHAPLLVGARVHRTDRVSAIEHKSGRSGEFVVVRVRSDFADQGGTLLLVEHQDLVYRDASVATPGPIRTDALPLVGGLLQRQVEGWSFRTDPTKLMRFSAATANGHRIHYDLAYATGTEGYPGLVVHGPLMTLALAEVLRLGGGAHIASLSHRNLSPMFCGEDGTIRTQVGADGALEVSLTSSRGIASRIEVRR